MEQLTCKESVRCHSVKSWTQNCLGFRSLILLPPWTFVWVGFFFLTPAQSQNHSGLIQTPEILGPLTHDSTSPLSFSSVIGEIQWTRTSNEIFLRRWFNEWSTVSEINGHALLPRSANEIFGRWPRTVSKKLDFEKSPFRLLASVFRPDLRNPEKPFGEARLIFELIDLVTERPLELNIIFEFQIPTSLARASLRSWAMELDSIASLPPLSQQEKILDIWQKIFAGKCSRRVGESCLLTIRTNDFFLQDIWELKEFRWNAFGSLSLSTTEQTPAMSYFYSLEGQKDLEAEVRNHQSQIDSGEYQLPQKFLGGSALAPSETFKWLERSELPQNTKDKFNLLTCNGCHAGTTDTRFTHITGNQFGSPLISQFLINQWAIREQDLQDLVAGTNKKIGVFVVH